MSPRDKKDRRVVCWGCAGLEDRGILMAQTWMKSREEFAGTALAGGQLARCMMLWDGINTGHWLPGMQELRRQTGMG